MDTADFNTDVETQSTLHTGAAVGPDSKKLAGLRSNKSKAKALAGALVALGLVAAGVVIGPRLIGSPPSPAAALPLPSVAVSVPLQRDISSRLQFLGQFSAVDRVELRAQVGGTLTQISFKDGDIVHKGDLLFVIDPTPYEIRLHQATAQLAAARARLELGRRLV